MDLLFSLWQLLFKWFCECVPPSDSQFGSLQEIEILESAWGIESPIPPPFYHICSYFDSCNFASSKSLMQWADTRKQMRRNFNCTQREKIDMSGTISATLGSYVKDFEVSFAFWAASLWQLSCSFLSGFITFCDYWKFQTAKIFKSW